MKQLINNLIAIFQSAVTAGRVAVLSVRKGIHNDPAQIPYTEYPYIAFDDGGQKVEEVKSDQAQRRVFHVLIEIAVNVLDVETSLDNILDIIDQCKTELELEANRSLLLDSHVWAIEMHTFQWGTDGKFFRGVQITCDFMELEIRMSDY